MKYFYLLALSFLVSCSGVKNVTKSLNSGNYDQAISKAVSKLGQIGFQEKSTLCHDS